MPVPCKFPALNICQKRFMKTHTEVDLALHPVVGLVLHVGDAEKFPLALDPFFIVSQQGHVSQPYKKMEVTRD